MQEIGEEIYWKGFNRTHCGEVERIEGDNYIVRMDNGSIMIVHKASARDIVGQLIEEQ